MKHNLHQNLPGASGAEGGTEVWTYASGDGRAVTFASGNAFTSGQSVTSGQATRVGNTATFGSNTVGSSNTNAFGFGVTRRFYCTVNVVFRDGIVSRVNYFRGRPLRCLLPASSGAYASAELQTLTPSLWARLRDRANETYCVRRLSVDNLQ